MVPKPRWGGLRIEPFDPDARDADGDGIVQEGTAWERPAGLQLVDELGRAIARGQTSKDPMRGLRYVDRSGQDVTYEPTWGKFVRAAGAPEPGYTKKRGLARLGLPSLKDRGHRSILDMQVAAMAEPNDVPEPEVPNAPAIERPRVADRIKRNPFISKLFSRISPESKHATPGAQDSLQRFKERTKRVTDRHGPINTHSEAINAINNAFPNLDIAFGQRTDFFLDPSGNLTPAERGWIIGLLDLADEDPDIAALMKEIDHRSGEGTLKDASAWAGVRLAAGPNGQPQFGYGLGFNTDNDWEGGYKRISKRLEDDADLSSLMAQIRGEIPFESDNAVGPERALVRQRFREQYASEIEEGIVTAEELETRLTLELTMKDKRLFHSTERASMAALVDEDDLDRNLAMEMQFSIIADHEWGHLRDFRARASDRGADLTEDQTEEWLSSVIPVEASGNMGLLTEYSSEAALDPEFFTQSYVERLQKEHQKGVKQVIKKMIDNAKQGHRNNAARGIGVGQKGSELDNISPEANAFIYYAMLQLSDYGTTDNLELTAELATLLNGDRDAFVERLASIAEQSPMFNYSQSEIADFIDTLDKWLKGDRAESMKPKKLQTAWMLGSTGGDPSNLSSTDVINRIRERLSGSRQEQDQIATRLRDAVTKQTKDILENPDLYSYDMDSYYGDNYTSAPRYFESMRKMVGAQITQAQTNLKQTEQALALMIESKDFDGKGSKDIDLLRQAASVIAEQSAQQAVLEFLQRQKESIDKQLADRMAMRNKSLPTSELVVKAIKQVKERSPRSTVDPADRPRESLNVLRGTDGSVLILLCSGYPQDESSVGFGGLRSKSFSMIIRNKASRRPLRPEPYDPDAQDGDGDGIVQDGTAWERPVGTRILTELGREVARDMMTMRPSQLNRIVDSDGNDVDYTPKWRSRPSRPTIGDKPEVDRKPMDLPEIPPPDKGPKSPLGKIGAPTLKERGMPTVDEMLSPPPMQADAPPEA
jgi:hypothetical protein